MASKLTVKILRESLAQLGPGHDDCAVKAWLPGSTITLNAVLIPRNGDMLIEGNIDPGSILEASIDKLVGR